MKMSAAKMLHTGYHYQEGPVAVRYPRGSGVGAPLQPLSELPIGKGIIRRQGKSIANFKLRNLITEALDVAEKLDATVADMRFYQTTR